jgi:putative tryptophan/tyrosine transport system substrate-binding protein
MRRREFITLVGGATAWPFVASAQQPPMPFVGFVSSRSPQESAYVVSAFRQGLKEGGFVEGQNVRIEYRWAEGKYDQLSALAADLVRDRVAVIVSAGGTVTALAVKAATPTIPTVFITAGIDPVKVGLVASLNRPGGNVTGVNMLSVALEAKRMQLLHELVPKATLVAILVNPKTPDVETEITDLEAAANTIGWQTHVERAASEAEFETAFDAIARHHADALVVAADPFFTGRREQLTTLAARYAIPAIYSLREYAGAGGLISYGTSLADGYRQAGMYAGRILKGAKPADLPVMQPTKFELVINMKTAKALGLTIPSGVMAIADEVIE